MPELKPRIPYSPLFNPIRGVPIYLHYTAWMLRRQLYYPTVTAYARLLNQLAAEYQSLPTDILPRARASFIAAIPENYNRTNLRIALRLWDEFSRERLPTGVPLEWVTTTGAIGDLIGIPGRKVVKFLKYFATQTHHSITEFEPTASKHGRMYGAPLKFYPFCVVQYLEEEKKWLTPPKEL